MCDLLLSKNFWLPRQDDPRSRSYCQTLPCIVCKTRSSRPQCRPSCGSSGCCCWWTSPCSPRTGTAFSGWAECASWSAGSPPASSWTPCSGRNCTCTASRLRHQTPAAPASCWRNPSHLPPPSCCLGWMFPPVPPHSGLPWGSEGQTHLPRRHPQTPLGWSRPPPCLQLQQCRWHRSWCWHPGSAQRQQLPSWWLYYSFLFCCSTLGTRSSGFGGGKRSFSFLGTTFGLAAFGKPVT